MRVILAAAIALGACSPARVELTSYWREHAFRYCANLRVPTSFCVQLARSELLRVAWAEPRI